ncbi:MAG: branched-chain amino acid ABC transporter ATP-binding protein/permease [Acidimicrobiales bacterium]|nr:branched-chain amino acid ABC transporter ATP-binding protein/permease [Acidimicrobiales bacterium]
MIAVSKDGLVERLARSAAASAVLAALLYAAGLLYTGSGGSARDLLVKELLVNLILVLGLQVFIGNTGVLSFGHLAFAQAAAYGVALVSIPVATKARQLPDVPVGLGGVHLGPVAATIAGVAVAVVLGAVIGIAVARAGGLAATMITLAVLFVVDSSVKNWSQLTKGAGGLSGVPVLQGSGWLWLAALAALVVAHGFAESRRGRFAIATREDEVAAPALGIGLFGARYGAWLVSMVLVGLAGALRVQVIGSTNPKQYTLDVAVLLLAMLVVGGMRTVSGAVLGTVVITAGTEAFRQLGDPDRLDIDRFPDLFLGVALLAVMLLRPGGLLGDTDLQAWLRRRFRRPAGADERAAPQRSAVLSADGIGVRFGGFVALDGARVQVRPGEVVGIIGPNGAGKTTLFNVLTGLVRPTAGTVRLGERELTGARPEHVARAGVARTFQNLRLFANLPVRENVAVVALVAGQHRRGEPAVDVDALLAAAGLTGLADRPAGTLDYGNQRRLELARAAALSPEFLLLDEPTSGMSDDEGQAMVDQVRAMAAMVGAGVLVIDHDLAFITRISDHVVALAEGAIIAEGTPDAVRADPAVAAAYLGTEG